MLTRFGSRDTDVWAKWSVLVRVGLGGVAIAAPLLVTAVGRAQQALPPPPSIPSGAAFPGGNELPSLAPVPPPTQGMPMAPTMVPPLPQDSFYQTPAPLPGQFPGSSVTPPLTSPTVKASFYQVVVPTRPEQFTLVTSKMVSMGVRPDAIQTSYRPLGPHVAVGPFVDQREAEGVSQYLRSGGMDARVFFTR